SSILAEAPPRVSGEGGSPLPSLPSPRVHCRVHSAPRRCPDHVRPPFGSRRGPVPVSTVSNTNHRVRNRPGCCEGSRQSSRCRRREPHPGGVGVSLSSGESPPTFHLPPQ